MKNVLLISNSFFSYDQEIKKAIEKLGFNVLLYNDRPNNNTLTKILIRITPLLVFEKIHKYYTGIINHVNGLKIDYVLFIKCESALPGDLKKMRQSFPNAKFILYLWDSVSMTKFYGRKKKFFDRVYSFDPYDVSENEEMIFKPLFYIDKFRLENTIDDEHVYAVSFIGSGHSDRAKVITCIQKQLEEQNLSYYFRLYYPNKIILFFQMLFDRNLRFLYKRNMIITNKMSSEDVKGIFCKSACVLDIEHPKQTGLTMRTIELIGVKKKIITTNKSVQQYDFYDESNIQVIDRYNPMIPKDFLKTEFKPINSDIYKRYSLDEWVKVFFE